MTTLYLQHGKAGEPMCTEKVRHQVTAPPKSKHKDSPSHVATGYLVWFEGKWRRVWSRNAQLTDLYIGYRYERIAVAIQED